MRTLAMMLAVACGAVGCGPTTPAQVPSPIVPPPMVTPPPTVVRSEAPARIAATAPSIERTTESAPLADASKDLAERARQERQRLIDRRRQRKAPYRPAVSDSGPDDFASIPPSASSTSSGPSRALRSNGAVHVRSYNRKDGTRVRAHTRNR